MALTARKIGQHQVRLKDHTLEQIREICNQYWRPNEWDRDRCAVCPIRVESRTKDNFCIFFDVADMDFKKDGCKRIGR